MYKYLPSKKFSLILLSIIVALGIIYGFSLFKKPKTISLSNTKTENQASAPAFLNLDSDNDGLKDWEEALWKTDPQKADSDGDGTVDGEEVRLDRDPTKQNINPAGQEPSDKIAEEIIAIRDEAQANFEELTVTEKVSRELFAQYIMAKKINPTLSTNDIENIVTMALSYVPEINFKIYTRKDIVINPLKDNETLRNYSNQIGKIILDNVKVPTEGVDTIISDAANTQNDQTLIEDTKKIFERFTPLVEKNQKIVADLLKIPVPEIFLTEHLSLLNSFQEIYESLNLMKNSANDIIILIMLKNNYYLSAQKLSNSLIKLMQKFYTVGIVFPDASDYGYQLFNVIMLRE